MSKSCSRKVNKTIAGHIKTKITKFIIKIIIYKAKRLSKETKKIIYVGKFRPRLIELTSFKSKLLIRFIMNKSC